MSNRNFARRFTGMLDILGSAFAVSADGPQNTPQYRGNVAVTLVHVVHTTFFEADEITGEPKKGNPRPNNKKEETQFIGSTDTIVHTFVNATVQTCQRRTLGLLGWGGWSNRALSECSSRQSFQYPSVYR